MIPLVRGWAGRRDDGEKPAVIRFFVLARYSIAGLNRLNTYTITQTKIDFTCFFPDYGDGPAETGPSGDLPHVIFERNLHGWETLPFEGGGEGQGGRFLAVHDEDP
jgi:hypothetical protein